MIITPLLLDSVLMKNLILSVTMKHSMVGYYDTITIFGGNDSIVKRQHHLISTYYFLFYFYFYLYFLSFLFQAKFIWKRR